MNRGNEVDMSDIQNAHILGQQRMPTKSEIKQMEKDTITIAVLQIAGTALSSMLESGKLNNHQSQVPTSLMVAKDILSKSESTKNDFDNNEQKRKLRNQLAAQLIYSTLRGGISYDKVITNNSFDAATILIKSAEEYAINEVEKLNPTSDIIAI